MQPISELVKPYNYIRKTKASERAQIISEIYEIYLQDKIGRKIANWKRYVEWCRTWKQEKGKESENKFKKSKFYLKELTVSQLCYFLSHIPTKDLYFTRSVVLDKLNRKESIGGYLLGSVKIQ